MQCSSLNFYGSTSYCAACPSASFGVYCSIIYHTMNLGDTYAVTLNPISYTPVRMKAGSKNGVSVTSLASGISVYFQFEKLSN